MKKIGMFLKKYRILFLFFLLQIMAGELMAQKRYFQNHPFHKEIAMENLTGYYHAPSGRHYLIDEGGLSIIVTDEEWNYEFTIDGGKESKSFYYAAELAADNEGNLYVLDYVNTQEGGTAVEERIVKYDSKGKFEAFLYENDMGEGRHLMGLSFWGNSLTFAEMTEDYVSRRVYTVFGDEIMSQNYPFDHAVEDIADTAISPEGDLSVVKKDGEVLRLNGRKEESIYRSSENDTGDFYSLAYEASYGADGKLYLNDIGLREIFCLDGNKKEIVVSRGETMDSAAESFEQNPIYSGMSVSGNPQEVSFITSVYSYDEALGDYTYTYHAYVKDLDGNTVYNGNTLRKSGSYLLKTVAVMLALLLAVLLAVVLLVEFIRLILCMKVDNTVKIQFAILITAGLVIIFATNMTVKEYNQRYIDEVVRGMTNISSMIGQLFEEEDINGLNCPEDYGGEAYSHVRDTIQKVLNEERNKENGTYCVIYKNVKDVICEVYSKYSYHGGFYPLAGSYEGSIEQSVWETKEPYILYDYSSAVGSYMFVLSPVLGEDGNTIALVETGIDLYEFAKSNEEMIRRIFTYMIMIIVVVILLVIEVMYGGGALKLRKKNKKEHAGFDSSLIRPGIFVIFFAANMSTAFLPLYGEKLWTESFPFPVEVAAAIPLSAEMLMVAATAFLMGFFIDKIGARLVCTVAVLFYLGGFLVSAFAANLWFLILANGLIGIGGGMFTTAMNSYIIGYQDMKQREQGFFCMNAAYLSGANCGTVVGSFIAERIGYRPVFYVGILVTVISAFLLIFCMEKRENAAEAEKEKETIGLLEFLRAPFVWRYFLLANMPLVICASFLGYFFPIYGAENDLSEMQISLAFLLSGVISIYLGPSLSGLVENRMKPKQALTLAMAMYAMGLLFFVGNASIGSCFVVIALFSAADSFGMTMKLVYYTSIPEVEAFGGGRATGINSLVENISSALGPVIFGYTLLLGAKFGIAVIAGAFLAMFLLFCIPVREKKTVS